MPITINKKREEDAFFVNIINNPDIKEKFGRDNLVIRMTYEVVEKFLESLEKQLAKSSNDSDMIMLFNFKEKGKFYLDKQTTINMFKAFSQFYDYCITDGMIGKSPYKERNSFLSN